MELLRFNREVEKAILGNCIVDTKTFAEVLGRGIEPLDFYFKSHGDLYECLIECYSTKNTTDQLILMPIANQKNILPSYITELVESTITTREIDVYLNELLELRITRERLRLAKDIQMGILIEEEDIKRRFDEIDLLKSKIGIDNTKITLDKIEYVDIKKAEKIKTGFKNIDDNFLGFVMGSLNIITGYNGSGKSTLVNQMCISESMAQGYKVFAYSPELTNSLFKTWLYETIANEDHFVLNEVEGKKYKTLGEKGKNYIDNWIKDKLLIYTDYSITTDENKIMQDMQNMALNGVKVFILDNLMKIDLDSNEKNELVAQKKFVNKVKNFTRKYNVIVHLIAHPRKPQPGNTLKLNQFDIAGTGDITNLADYVMGIQRLDKEDKEKVDKDAIVKVFKDRIQGKSGISSFVKYTRHRRRYTESINDLQKDYGYTKNIDLVAVEQIQFEEDNQKHER